MGTLYIDRKGLTVKLHEGALTFYANNTHAGTVPINPLKRVIVIGSVSIETPVLNRLCDENIAVLFLSGRRMRFHGRLQGKLHNNSLLRVKQYEKSLSTFSCEFSCNIVSRKIAAQKALLTEALTGRPDLRFPLTTALGTLATIEESLRTIRNCDADIPALRTAPVTNTESVMADFLVTSIAVILLHWVDTYSDDRWQAAGCRNECRPQSCPCGRRASAASF